VPCARRPDDRRYEAVLSDAQETRVPVSRERLPELRRRLGLGA
jgi:DNA-binding LytR/AlgR family response regulator